MEIATYLLKLFYYNQAKQQDKRFYAEMMRLQVVELLNIQIDPKQRYRDAKHLWKFTWEEEEERKLQVPLTPEQQKKQLSQLKELATRILK